MAIDEGKYLFESMDNFIRTLVCVTEDGQLCIVDVADGRCLVSNPKCFLHPVKDLKVVEENAIDVLVNLKVYDS